MVFNQDSSSFDNSCNSVSSAARCRKRSYSFKLVQEVLHSGNLIRLITPKMVGLPVNYK